MTLDISILRMADSLAAYASVRQGVIAQNIAHADTPGYRSRDVLPFAEAYGEMARAPMPAAARPAPTATRWGWRIR